MNNYARGKFAELLAAAYMLCHGYKIVKRNFITGRGTTAGEIDLIMRRGKTLVFVEIKQRSSLDNAAYAITKQQRMRIIRGARSFLKSYPIYHRYNIRFDAILITLPWQIKHIPNAWQEG